MAGPVTAAYWIRRAAALAGNEKTGNAVGTILTAFLLPFILIIVCLCGMMDAAADHNRAAVEWCFGDGAIPAAVPEEYAGHITQMRACFAVLDGAVGKLNAELEEGSVPLRANRVKADFFALNFGAPDLTLHQGQAESFAGCYVSEAVRIRTVEAPNPEYDPPEDEEELEDYDVPKTIEVEQEYMVTVELFCDKLARQAEVASAYLEGDMLRVGFRPECCPRLKNRGRIRVLRAEPGGPVREIQIENRLEAFQKSVGGYIECAGLKDGAVLICDDEGKLKGLRPNRRLGGDLIVGTFLIAGVDAEGDFCSLTETQAERWKKELAEPIKNIESLVQLRDLLQIGLPDNTYLVHRDADIGVCPADGLRLDALPEKIQTAWNDVLAAQVCWIRQGAYGPEIVLAGVDPQRVYDFSFMLIEEIDECPGQAVAPELSME